MSRIPTAEEITANWGERCPDYGEGCPCCEMWAMHDEIERLRKALEKVCTAIEREPVCGGDLDYPHGHNDWLGWRKKIMRPAVVAARAALDAIKEG